MYLLTRENFSNMAKEVKSAVNEFGGELKHTQILDALASGLGENDFQALTKTAVHYKKGNKPLKVYIHPDLKSVVKIT